MDILFGFSATLLIIFAVPVIVYGIFAKYFGVSEPERKTSFFLGVLIEKIGTSGAFMALFYFSKDYFVDRWWLFALVWFLMFFLSEIGQVLLKGSSKKEAVAGMISEAIYFPLAALAMSLMFR